MAKSLFAAVLFVAAALGACLAWSIRNRGSRRILSLAEAFAGGAVLGAGLLHLLPEASTDWEEIWEAEATDEIEEDEDEEQEAYPWPQLLCAMGCLGTHCLEVVAQHLWQRSNKVAREAPQSLAEEPAASGSEVRPDTFGKELEDESPSKYREDHDLEQEDLVHARSGVDALRSPHSHFLGPLLMLALSVHSLLEGLSLGASNPAHAVDLFIAIFAHKSVAAFALGVAWLSSKNGARTYGPAMMWFACVTPLGILLGLPAEGSLVAVGVTALSSGTFLYIGLIEGCPGVHAPWLPGWAAVQQAASYFIGFLSMAALAAWT